MEHMDRRLFLAIGLSILVLFVYYTVFPPPAPMPPTEQQVTEQRNDAPARQEQSAGQVTAVAPSDLRTSRLPAAIRSDQRAQSLAARVVKVRTPLYEAIFDTQGGTLIRMDLEDYKVWKENIDWADIIPFLRGLISKQEVDPDVRMNMVQQLLGTQPVFGVVLADEDRLSARLKHLVYSTDADDLSIVAGGGPRKLTLTASTEEGLTIRKVFTFQPDTYVVNYELSIINQSSGDRPLRVISQFGEGPDISEFNSGYGAQVHTGPIWREQGEVETESAEDIETQIYVREPDWAGITSNYFLTAVSPQSPITRAVYQADAVPGVKGEDETWAAYYGVELPAVSLRPDQMVSSAFSLYMGPKNTEDLAKFAPSLEESLDLNLDFIAVPMLSLLKWFHRFTGNFGLDIILLTIVVRVVLFPLTYKGMVSMKRMQKLQPRMVAAREKFKNDKEKLNKEMMGLYKRNKVNPLGGCLPILMQIPIFFALYSALLGAIELRHTAFFGWLIDLSAKDGLYILPLLMGVSMFAQQRLSPTSPDPTQAKIMMWLPVIFTVFMFGFPSGLVLYWFTSNLLSIGQQIIINRVKIPEPVEQSA